MTKSRIYNRIQNNFTQISNLALLDTRLSGKAYKLYAYMVFRLGTSPDWYFYEEEILKHFKESRDAIRTAFKELIDNGWLIRRRLKNDKGQYSMTEYEIFSEPQNIDSDPQTENPSVDNPAVDDPSEEKAAQEKPAAEKPSYNNKEEINKDSNNKDFISLPPEEKKEFLKKIFLEKNLKSDPEKYFLFREKDFWKGVKNLEADIAWWENGHKEKFPELHIEKSANDINVVSKKTEPKMPKEIMEINEMIRREIYHADEALGMAHYFKYFQDRPIEKTPSGYLIKVDDERALRYEGVLRKINVEIICKIS